MSTILDALRKVERERASSLDQIVDAAPAAPEVRRRRNLPLAGVVVCAILGFSGGAILSWWFPADPQVEVAVLPVPPPPPAIPVPRAPLPANPLVPPKAESPDGDIAIASPVGKAGDQAKASGEASVEVAVAPKSMGQPPAAASRSLDETHGPIEALTTLGKDESALEPSPFRAPHEAVPGNAPAGGSAKVDPPRQDEAAIAADVPDGGLAALSRTAPTAPEAPPAEPPPDGESEPEPETPPEKLVDTGRSPPGAPKVALSFLQWSPEPARRFAFISIDGAPTQRVHEGEIAAGLTVAAITPTGVQFKREGTTFTIRPRH